MRHRRLAVLLLFVLAFAAAGCRGVQIRQLEERADKIENRLAAIEAKLDMLTKK
jgi:hypothetical protein